MHSNTSTRPHTLSGRVELNEALWGPVYLHITPRLYNFDGKDEAEGVGIRHSVFP